MHGQNTVTALPFGYGGHGRNAGTHSSCCNAERISCLVQVTLYASAEVTSGNYSLTYASMWANATTGNLNSHAETTVCLDWNAEEDEARVAVLVCIFIKKCFLLTLFYVNNTIITGGGQSIGRVKSFENCHYFSTLVSSIFSTV